MKRLFISLLFLLTLLSCKNDVDLFSDDSSYKKISIEITGDENIIINTDIIEIKTGTKWKTAKRKAIRCIQYKKGYVFASSFLDEEQLTDDYVFEIDVTIYITSKLKNANSEQNIKLTLKADKNIELDDDEFIINGNTAWQEIKDEVNARLKFQLGYKLLEWRLGRSKNAKVLNDSYVFKRNCTIYAVSEECEKIILNLIGGENVFLQYTVLEISFAFKWEQIKNTEYISSTKALNGYKLSDWKLENDVNGENITDDYIFTSDATLYIFAIKDYTDEPTLPEQPISPDLPINIEIDELGMVTVIPPVDGIREEKIDYKLCNFPKQQNEKRWQGVFIEGKLITISPYKIHQYETTYKLWKEVYEWAILNGYVFENAGRMGSSEMSNIEAKEDEPVTCVSYRDCLIWCNAYTEKLNGNVFSCVYLENENGKVLKNAKEEKNGKNLCDNAYVDFTKKGMRLPKEAEWEFAARLQLKTKTNAVLCGGVYLTKLNSASGASLPICTPDLKVSSNEKAYNELFSNVVCKWFYDGTVLAYFTPRITKTSSVGTKRRNQAGLYDMSGNVAEWCSDFTTDAMFSISGDGQFAIIRGGAWSYYSYVCSVGYREVNLTNYAASNIGFRLCQTK